VLLMAGTPRLSKVAAIDRLDQASMDGLKQALLQALSTESDEKVRNKLCDTGKLTRLPYDTQTAKLP
jgi:hypothetical protein